MPFLSQTLSYSRVGIYVFIRRENFRRNGGGGGVHVDDDDDDENDVVDDAGGGVGGLCWGGCLGLAGQT